MASICVAFRSFCCDSLPLTLSLDGWTPFQTDRQTDRLTAPSIPHGPSCQPSTGGRTRHTVRADRVDSGGKNRGGSNWDWQGDPGPSRVGGGLRGSRRRNQALFSLRQELTRFHFKRVNHRLLHQRLTGREGGRMRLREVGVGGLTLWSLNFKIKWGWRKRTQWDIYGSLTCIAASLQRSSVWGSQRSDSKVPELNTSRYFTRTKMEHHNPSAHYIQELTRLHFEGVNHGLLHQGLTDREGGRWDINGSRKEKTGSKPSITCIGLFYHFLARRGGLWLASASGCITSHPLVVCTYSEREGEKILKIWCWCQRSTFKDLKIIRIHKTITFFISPTKIQLNVSEVLNPSQIFNTMKCFI